jgi:hypothetical protein
MINIYRAFMIHQAEICMNFSHLVQSFRRTLEPVGRTEAETAPADSKPTSRPDFSAQLCYKSP